MAASAPLTGPLLFHRPHLLLVLLAAGTVPLVTLQGPLVHALQGFRDVTGAQGANLAFGVALTVTTVVGVLASGLNGATVALLIANLIYTAVLARRLAALTRAAGATPVLRRGLRRDVLRRPAVRAMMGIGFASLFVGVLSGLGELVVRTTILHEDSTSGAGIYQALNLMSLQIFGVIATSVAFFSFTAISEARARGDDEAVRRALDDAVRLALLIALPGVLLIGLLRSAFVSAFLDLSDFGAAIHLMPLQLGADILRTTAWVLGAALVPLGMTRQWTLVTASSTIALVGVSLALVPSLGVKGAVIGYLAQWTLAVISNVLVLGRRWYRPGRRSLAVFAGAAAIAVLVATVPPGYSAAAALGAVVVPVLAFVGTGPEERAALLATIRSRLGRAGAR